ncbi:hypothetical protein M413DRAFT_89215 [Hebeloma cylindrosporum]|uniref:Uncharacterized protein n=1 Tax=Hebeloma cylindrosporum TaxID=76867 RepID=A0A0C2YGQ4_HEBCY|nr:hypothetical protein M413DRAFT_89215 [Hebeloma cylindrosporum h7]
MQDGAWRERFCINDFLDKPGFFNSISTLPQLENPLLETHHVVNLILLWDPKFFAPTAGTRRGHVKFGLEIVVYRRCQSARTRCSVLTQWELRVAIELAFSYPIWLMIGWNLSAVLEGVGKLYPSVILPSEVSTFVGLFTWKLAILVLKSFLLPLCCHPWIWLAVSHALYYFFIDGNANGS